MSFGAIYTVHCDSARLESGVAPDCIAWQGQEDTKAEAAADAKAHGWQRVRSSTYPYRKTYDLCPPCARRHAKIEQAGRG